MPSYGRKICKQTLDAYFTTIAQWSRALRISYTNTTGVLYSIFYIVCSVHIREDGENYTLAWLKDNTTSFCLVFVLVCFSLQLLFFVHTRISTGSSSRRVDIEHNVAHIVCRWKWFGIWYRSGVLVSDWKDLGLGQINCVGRRNGCVDGPILQLRSSPLCTISVELIPFH